MPKLLNEYRDLPDRDGVGDMTTSNLIREFAQLKVSAAISEIDRGQGWHDRLGSVVDELRRRGLLNEY